LPAGATPGEARQRYPRKGARAAHRHRRRHRRGDGAGDTPPLTGTTLDGATFDLADTKGKPTVINFFASWCPPCNDEAPDLVAFSEAHPEIEVVGVAVRDQRADTEAFVASYGLAYPVVFDPEGETWTTWGLSGIPTTFFLDADGAVTDTIVGAATRDQFEASLETAL
jgi:thiol-disulfide isomerase/thioredoxin